MYTLEMPPVSLTQVFVSFFILFGILILVSNGAGAISKLFSPFRRMREENKASIDAVRGKLEAHRNEVEKRLDGNDVKLARDLARFEKHDELHEEERRQREADRADIAVLMKGQLALLEHARTDNSTGLMDAASKELQQHLIDRK